MPSSLDELIKTSREATEPAWTPNNSPVPGGVDPLGLRQINFDLMDKVFPGVNNVVRHIRPFTVVTWAWHRAAIIAKNKSKKDVPVSTLKDFVDRVEVLFAWSQFLRNSDSNLPGRDVLAPLIEASNYRFGGNEWTHRKKSRVYSTSLSAPINYGPSLKSLYWLQPHSTGAFSPCLEAQDAIGSLESSLKKHLTHPAFSEFGDITISKKDVLRWADAWALDDPSASEKKAMAASLAGGIAPKCRQDAIKLVSAACKHLGKSYSLESLRKVMCGPPSDFTAPETLSDASKAWRALQVRQAFRLALEAMFYWVCYFLDDGPRTAGALSQKFLSAAGKEKSTSQWLKNGINKKLGPADLIEKMTLCLQDDSHWDDLPKTLRTTFSNCFVEETIGSETDRYDRLPLVRATKESYAWRDHPASDFISHMINSWVFGQHVYWSVGRGLGDARAKGKTLLRLRVSLENNRWSLMPGAFPSVPNPTPDRLETITCLMKEADIL